VLRNLADWDRHLRAPRVECRRRSDRRQGRQSAGHQRCRQRKGEGPGGRRRVVRVGCGAAAVRLGLRDNSVGACARFSGSVHRTVGTAQAAGHARLRRCLPARALGPSSGSEGESDKECRRASEQPFHVLRMHGWHTGVNSMRDIRAQRCGCASDGSPALQIQRGHTSQPTAATNAAQLTSPKTRAMIPPSRFAFRRYHMM